MMAPPPSPLMFTQRMTLEEVSATNNPGAPPLTPYERPLGAEKVARVPEVGEFLTPLTPLPAPVVTPHWHPGGSLDRPGLEQAEVEQVQGMGGEAPPGHTAPAGHRVHPAVGVAPMAPPAHAYPGEQVQGPLQLEVASPGVAAYTPGGQGFVPVPPAPHQ